MFRGFVGVFAAICLLFALTIAILLAVGAAIGVSKVEVRTRANVNDNELDTVEPAAEPYFDIGGFSCPVTTSSRLAQTWFDRGLAMCHAFNHEEAIRCFESALAADPRCAMAYWGMAYAWGPNINNMEIAAESIAQASLALRMAKLHSGHLAKWEKAVIAAMDGRYVTPVPRDRQPLNESYAKAMRAVHQNHADQPLVAALFAEALMDLRPWALWSRDGQPSDVTPELVSVLEDGLERWPNHPMLCHLYIHAIEASPHPEKALEAANRLRNLVPGAGHLLHMPTHIDVLLGDYQQVVDSNLRAIQADRQFLAKHGPMNFFTIYRVHNYHFVVYGAMFDGRSELALRTAEELVHQIPEDLLKSKTDMFDAFVPVKLHALVRFGRWEQLLLEPEPADYLPMSRATWHYARGIAYAALKRVPEAEAEQAMFVKARLSIPETSMLYNNKSRSLLDIAERMLAGEIAYRRAEYENAFAALRQSVELYDQLNYDEPWGWMQPTRHALGALLLEQGQVEEAEAVFLADLRQHPRNLWALQGLEEALRKQNLDDEAARVANELREAAARADIQVDRACYCKLSGPVHHSAR